MDICIRYMYTLYSAYFSHYVHEHFKKYYIKNSKI
jgi:hypothetical protein